MAAAVLPILFFSLVWGGVGFGLPVMVPKGPHRGLIKCILMLTAVTCWLFWLCCYLAQMNPLIGPKLKQNAIYMMAKEWGSPIIKG